MENKERIQELLEQADPQLMENYMRMFERILLFNIATAAIPQELIDGSVSLWDKIVKKGIDMDASKRTEYLEATLPGRLARLRNEPDGEDLRNHCLEQQQIARNVIIANLTKRDSWENGNEEAET